MTYDARRPFKLEGLTAASVPSSEAVAWLRDQRDGYEGPETLDPLVILTKHDPGKGINGATYSAVGYVAAAPARAGVPVATVEVRHHAHEVMEHQITLNAEFDEALNRMPHGTKVSLCVEASINEGNSERDGGSPIMTVLGGRVTTNFAMLPKALRTNRPTRAEVDVAAEVIERLYSELQAARRDARPAVPSADSATRLVDAIAEADTTIRADGVEWLREDAASAREHDPNAGIRANRALADLFDVIADCLEEPGSRAESDLDPAVVSKDDLEVLSYVEDLVRGNGFADKADRLAYLHGVLARVAQGREASHYRESYDRAVQRLVQMRQLVPADLLRAFEVEWRTRKREPLADAQQLNLPEEVRGELHQMAEHCGAVCYSPPPLRAVRGVSLTFAQLEAFAVLVSGAVWPVPPAESR